VATAACLAGNSSSVVCNVSSVNTSHILTKGELECIWCSMLKNFKG
jgi:hypothetical protein